MMRQVPASGRVGLCIRQEGGGCLPDRREQPEPGPRAGLPAQQGPVDEGADDLSGVDAAHHGLGRVDGKRSPEHAQGAQGRSLPRREQVQAPANGRVEGPVPFGTRPIPPPGEQALPPQPLGELDDLQDADARRGQFEGQGQAVELPRHGRQDRGLHPCGAPGARFLGPRP